ncbi:hypothetical protein [Mesorhizobium sp.]|uniref:hypothetical protein n=1 Tax=Mesorhizobium sp. TaxID=1871066 RepID=UPI000FE6E88B|nr:hypothetical protein [Mesorhizobium sp.]RWB67597.1 MAG: hypothetical protein EOQ49_25085 [Mesorhizobium sp.]
MSISNARFAQWCARLSAKSAGWAGDILDSPNEPARRENVERFIREIRDRLNYMEEELNG